MIAKKWIGLGLAVAALGGAAAIAQYRDTEEPGYSVVAAEAGFELRDYAPMVVAEVTHTASSRRAASSASFRRLAAYIFAQDRPAGGEEIAMTSPVIHERVPADEKIAMTAPVLEEKTGQDTWRMRFVMPSKYTLESLPEAPADITLTTVPVRRVAAIRFNGWGRDQDLEMMVGLLEDWMKDRGLKAIGAPEYAFYDAPMVPGPYRRNEVLIPVSAD